jgi:hypothetical protein
LDVLMPHPCKNLDALLPFHSDAAWAKLGSFGFDAYSRRAAANAERDPDALSLIELQFQLHTRIGPGRGSSEDESWASAQARELGRVLASVKKRVGHGAFGPWVKAFSLFSPTTARRYLRAGASQDHIEPQAAPIAKINPDAERARFIDAFGPRGQLWFEHGMTFEDALSLYRSMFPASRR